MKYDKMPPFKAAEDTFEWHVLEHMLVEGDISLEYYENSVRELKAKYTKLADLLNGEDE